MVGRNSLTFSLSTGELYGLEKFWAFRKYYRDWTSIASHSIDAWLVAKLNEYKTIDDFRLDVRNCLFDYLLHPVICSSLMIFLINYTRRTPLLNEK